MRRGTLFGDGDSGDDVIADGGSFEFLGLVKDGEVGTELFGSFDLE